MDLKTLRALVFISAALTLAWYVTVLVRLAQIVRWTKQCFHVLVWTADQQDAGKRPYVSSGEQIIECPTCRLGMTMSVADVRQLQEIICMRCGSAFRPSLRERQEAE